MAERRRLQILPELGISDADQRKIGLVINPGNFSDEPLAAATLLQADECAIEQLIGGGQDLTVAYHCAGFVGFAGFAIASAQSPQAKSKFAKLDSSRIHYLNYGKGDEALVLIHGWTQNADAWRDNVADLSARNRVIVVELPGHGQSDKPQLTYSMDYFARAVETVMRDAKVKRAVLVGHSMGTPIARQFYRKYPDQTLAIVIVDGSLRPFGDQAMIDQLMGGLRGAKYQDTVSQMMAFMGGANLSAEAKQRISAASMNTPQPVMVSLLTLFQSNGSAGKVTARVAGSR